MSSLTHLPWFYKCYQIHPLQLMVNKSKIKGGRGVLFPPLPGAAGNTGFAHRATCAAVSGICFFPGFTQPSNSRGPNLLAAVQLVKPASPTEPSRSGTAPPSPHQVGCVWSSTVCSPCAAPSSSSSPMPAISEPKFTSLRVKCPPAMHGVGAEVVFGAGGPRMVPRQPLGKCPPSLCTGGCGRGSEVCVPHTTALGHDELSPRHRVILRVLLDV